MYSQNSPTFQIDAHCGYPAALLNALLQTPDTATLNEPLTITLLPALPVAQWPSGSLQGAHIRGGIVLDLFREDGKPTHANFTVKGSDILHRQVKVMYAGNVVSAFDTSKAGDVDVDF